jgi:hypothetical protein
MSQIIKMIAMGNSDFCLKDVVFRNKKYLVPIALKLETAKREIHNQVNGLL